ncbi:unnamed protein product [Clavelina lepadiformis]|uniref:DNA-directed RNA polymerase III subunit RPC3 n=1 Tax=Clavelina lepadiformis TaxID=159417 RepID=A0ABP0GGJ2_CLALP
MCSKESHLCEELICEHYGNLVAKVAGYLCRNGWQLLRSIASGTKLKHDQIRKALCVLIQHKLVQFQMRKQIIEYKADIKSIVNLIFYPRMIYTAKLLYGDIAELIVEETLFLGIGLMSEILKRVLDRWQNSTQEENKVDKVQKAFQDLVHTHFLQREPELWITDDNGDDVIPTFSSTKENLYRIPLISENTLKRQRSEENEGEPQAKRQKKCGEVDDDGIYWSINIQRFEQYFRDQAIVSAATRKHGQACGEIVRAMLRISEVTTLSDAWKTQLVSAAEIFRALPPNYTLSAEVRKTQRESLKKI